MGGNAQATLVQFLPLVILIAVMYFLMIRPQRKKDKAINEMRRSLTVGDEIVTIGGIVGKIVKTKDETIVIQVGADKIKMEMMRWAVSSVTKEAHGKAREVYEEVKEEERREKWLKWVNQEKQKMQGIADIRMRAAQNALKAAMRAQRAEMEIKAAQRAVAGLN